MRAKGCTRRELGWCEEKQQCGVVRMWCDSDTDCDVELYVEPSNMLFELLAVRCSLRLCRSGPDASLDRAIDCIKQHHINHMIPHQR